MSYPEVLKARMIRRMAGPERHSVRTLAAETDIFTRFSFPLAQRSRRRHETDTTRRTASASNRG